MHCFCVVAELLVVYDCKSDCKFVLCKPCDRLVFSIEMLLCFVLVLASQLVSYSIGLYRFDLLLVNVFRRLHGVVMSSVPGAMLAAGQKR